MNLSFPTPALMPTVNDFTYNSEGATGIAGSYDLICFPGIIISRLAADTVTCSTGRALAVANLYVEEPYRRGESVAISACSTDSSVLGARDAPVESGGFATQFKFPCREPITLDLAALMTLLGGLVAMVLETEGPNSAPTISP